MMMMALAGEAADRIQGLGLGGCHNIGSSSASPSLPQPLKTLKLYNRCTMQASATPYSEHPGSGTGTIAGPSPSSDLQRAVPDTCVSWLGPCGEK